MQWSAKGMTKQKSLCFLGGGLILTLKKKFLSVWCPNVVGLKSPQKKLRFQPPPWGENWKEKFLIFITFYLFAKKMGNIFKQKRIDKIEFRALPGEWGKK